MPAPSITELPPPPLRSQSPTTFSGTAETFVEALPEMVDELNAFIAYLNGLALSGVTGPITSTALTMATARLLGRSTGGSGAIEEITLGLGLALSAGVLSTRYRIGFFFTSAPSASEVLALHVVTEAMTIPANFASPSSKGAVGTNPAASFVLDVQKNGSSIGTITISTGGVFTFATSSGTSKSVAAGDVIKVVGPATPDTSIANVAITLVGSA